MSKYIKLKDVEKVIDKFAGYLDDDMIYRIKYKINHDCQLFEEFTPKGKWVHIGGDEWCCSECGFVISTEGSWEEPTKKYCEDCGTEMEVEFSW